MGEMKDGLKKFGGEQFNEQFGDKIENLKDGVRNNGIVQGVKKGYDTVKGVRDDVKEKYDNLKGKIDDVKEVVGNYVGEENVGKFTDATANFILNIVCSCIREFTHILL